MEKRPNFHDMLASIRPSEINLGTLGQLCTPECADAKASAEGFLNAIDRLAGPLCKKSRRHAVETAITGSTTREEIVQRLKGYRDDVAESIRSAASSSDPLPDMHAMWVSETIGSTASEDCLQTYGVALSSHV